PTVVRVGSNSQLPDARAVVASNGISNGVRGTRPSERRAPAPPGRRCCPAGRGVASTPSRSPATTVVATSRPQQPSERRRTARVRTTPGALAVTLIADIPTQRTSTETVPQPAGKIDLWIGQQETLAAARRPYSIPARIMFLQMDLLYGRRNTVQKFRVLETVARLPYEAWATTS